MFAKSSAPSFMQPKAKRQQSDATTAAEGASRLGRLATTAKKKEGGDMVSRLQQYSADENKRAAEAKKKKATPASVAPSKGFFGKMVDKYYYGKKDE